jgi:hypothetical protein
VISSIKCGCDSGGKDTDIGQHPKRGLFTGQDFIYDSEKDHYTCPAGEHLTRGLIIKLV